MFRSTFGALNVLLRGGAARGILVRDIIGRAPWARSLLKGQAVPWRQKALVSQLSASRFTATRTVPRRWPFRSPFSAPKRPFHFSRARRAENGKAAAEESLSFSARMKKLSREYGWTSVGVYLALSVLDFPFCFLLVRTVGTEKIAYLEHLVVDNVKRLIPESVQNFWREYREAARQKSQEKIGETGEVVVIGHGVAEAEERSKQDGASLATQLALAYAIHKSFIFVRVPLTAAVTPKVVKVLRSWGWQIGKRKAKRVT